MAPHPKRKRRGINLSLAGQFRLISLVILLLGMLILGNWMGAQIERSVINRTAAVTSLYVDSFISPHLQSLAVDGTLHPADLEKLDQLLTDTPLGQEIVSFKVWAPDGRIIYSPNQALIGNQYPIRSNLERAFGGTVQAEISSLDHDEQAYEKQFWEQLIETYAPARATGSGQVIAVSEFYQLPDPLVAEIQSARRLSWIVVGLAGLMMYLALSGMVGRASNTIQTQQSELRQKVDQLGNLLAQNKRLHGRVQRAAARTTSLNEQFLRRISADLHDGPSQDIALALLRLDDISEEIHRLLPQGEETRSVVKDFQTVKAALEGALDELRTTSAGLRLPEIEALSLPNTVKRVVRDYRRKTQCAVQLELEDLPQEAPLPLKITLYRVLQEALANGFRHAGAQGQRVQVAGVGDQIFAHVSDSGPGFQPASVPANGHLGLIGMKERVELLGGRCEISSAPHQGTTIRVYLPLTLPEEKDA